MCFSFSLQANARRSTMTEAVLILPNMRGGCATVGTTVHTLFRVSGRTTRPMAAPTDSSRAGRQDAPAAGELSEPRA
jgi:hypothetical protein